MKYLRLLWKYMQGYRTLYVVAIGAIGAETFLRFVWPLLLRITIDSVIGDKPLEAGSWLSPLFSYLYQLAGGRSILIQALWMCSLMLVLLTLARGIFLFYKGKLSAVASEAIVCNLRDKLYNHLQYLPFGYHVRARTGDLVQRCTSDVETIRRFIGIQFVEVGRALFMIGMALTFMLPLSSRMTLISLSLVPFIFTFAFIFFLKVKKAFQQSDEAEGRLSAVLQENLTGVRVVRAFTRQSYEIGKFDRHNLEYRDLNYRLIRLLAWYWSVSDFLCLTQIAAVIIAGTYWAARGTITIGTMLAFSTYVGMLLWPVRQLGRVLTDMGKAMVSVSRIEEILAEPAEEFRETAADIDIRGEIEFDRVSFAFEPGKPVLQDISFRVEPGQTVALLGPTGSGKSTLVSLLPRLYDYQAGSIRIDGRELKDLDKQVIRSKIGLALQEPFLFSRTIRDNIRLARKQASEQEVNEVACCAAIHQSIQEFEKGYDTEVGERGVTLSGGQKQRLNIARTLINNAPIMIFDDSLSAVDTETDAQIRRELQKRRQRATTFIISHRLTTLAEADRIIVLQQGRIVQQGTHLELMSQEGLYRRLWNLQNELESELALEVTAQEVAGMATDQEESGQKIVS